MHILAELIPLNGGSGARPVLRAASADDRAITGLNDQIWWPAISQKPTLSIRLFDGDFSAPVQPGQASFTIRMDALEKQDASARSYLWQGAGVTLYAGDSATAWPWTTVFKGEVSGFEAQGNSLRLTATVDESPFEKNALSATYAGTTGIEGGADLKNRPKPWLLGRCFNVEPILINAVDSVFQVSAYGAIEAVNALYERGASLGASTGDHATYAALVAATIAPGRWATCLASGLIRLGAPPYGVITADVDGDKFGATWRRKTGEIIQRIATGAGVSTGDLDTVSLAALDTTLSGLTNQGRIGIYLTEQESVLSIARRLALPCNAQAGVSWIGKLFVTRVTIGSAVVTFDAQGRQLPAVTRSAEVDVSPPYKRISMGAARSWRVHSLDEVATSDPWIERGIYDAAVVYRAGNVVSLADGSRFRYKNTTPTAGNTPPNATYWEATNDGPTRNVPQGDWLAGIDYVFGDMVSYGGGSYQALTAHTSSALSPPSPSNPNWMVMAEKGEDGTNGTNGASTRAITLYRRTPTNSAPAKPDNNIDINITDNSTSGSLDGWSLVESSAVNGAYRWSITGIATTTGTVATLTPAAWGTQTLIGVDDFVVAMGGTTLPSNADGSVKSAYLPFETQLTFSTTNTGALLDATHDAGGFTVAEVSETGCTGTINTAAGTPIAGKPKGFVRITAVDPATLVPKYVAKVVKDGIDYPATLVLNKAIEGGDGRSALLTPSTDRIKLNTAGELWPPGQSISLSIAGVGFTGATILWKIYANGAELTPTTSYLSDDNSSPITLNIPAILAAVGDTPFITIWGYVDDVRGPPVIIWLDREMAVPGNEWPDPQFASGDSNWGAAATAPFFLQTDGAAGNYQFKNYLQIYQVGVAADRLIKVAEGIPVNHAGETIYFGFVGGKISGSTHYSAGIYMKFYDVDGVQVGSTVTLVNQTVFDPTGNWPHYYGEAVTPAGAATREIGFISDHLGGGTSNMNYVIASPYSQRYELNANNTEQRTAAHRTPPLTQEVPAGVTSGIKSYPTALNFYRDQGATDVTASATWAAYPSAGISCSISVVGSAAVLSITAMSQPGTIDVVSTRNNLNVRSRLTFVPNYDAEPQIGGSVSADSPSIAAVTSTSYVTAIGPIRVDTKSAGRIDFMGQLVIAPAFTGTGGADMRPRYRTPIGSGTWVEIGMIVNAGDVTFSADNPTKARSGATLQVSGLLTNTAYEVDFRIKKSATSTAAAVVLHAGTRGVAQGL